LKRPSTSKKWKSTTTQYDLYINKKRATKPVEPKFVGAKTMSLYKQIIKENPKFDRIDEILFLAGYRGRETKDPNYAAYLKALIKNYPNSKFLADAYMEIGEDHFEQT
jgi:hypothetical protein